VGQRADGAEIQEAGHALHGVERPEDGVDVILVLGLLLEVEDVHLDLADVLEPLGDEIPEKRFVPGLFLSGLRGRRRGRLFRRRSGGSLGLRLRGKAQAGGEFPHESVDAPLVAPAIAVAVGHRLKEHDAALEQPEARRGVDALEDHLLEQTGQASRKPPGLGGPEGFRMPRDPFELVQKLPRRRDVDLLLFEEEKARCHLVDFAPQFSVIHVTSSSPVPRRSGPGEGPGPPRRA